MKLISSIICFFFSSLLFAQLDTVWTQSFFDESSNHCSGRFVIQTSDGGFMISAFNQTNSDFWLIKTDSNGNEEWNNHYGSSHDGGTDNPLRTIIQTSDDSYIIVGGSQIIKLDDEGNEQINIETDEYTDNWDAYYVIHKIYDIQETTDGGFIIVGQETEWCYNTIKLIKLDADLIPIWGRCNESFEDFGGFSVSETSDGGYVIVGDFPYLIKTDSEGNQLWVKYFENLSNPRTYSVRETSNGEYIFTGIHYLNEGSNVYYQNIFLIKTDNQGNEIFFKNFGHENNLSENNYLGYSLDITSDGGYIIAGYISNPSGNSNSNEDGIIIKTDSEGNQDWVQIYDEEYNERFYSIRETSDGGLIVVGQNNVDGTDQAFDIWLLKLDIVPPTISDIPNQEINEDETLSYEIDFSAGSGENINITVNSDDNNVDVSIENNVLLVNPTINWFGTANIEIMIIDENFLFDETEFLLTVNAINDSPQEFGLIYPTISDTLTINTDTDDAYLFFWESSEDVDSDVNYIMTITLDYFGDTYSETYESNDSTIMVSGYEWSSLMTNLNLQRWGLEYTVEATDGEYTVESEAGEFVFENSALSIDEGLIPISFNLYQNHPNPFNPITTIRYDLPEATNVTISIYDMMGREIKSLINTNQNSGYKSVIWNGTNDNGEIVSGGMYFYSIKTNIFSRTKKMILLK